MHLCLGPVALDRGGRGAHLYGMPPSPRHLSLTADHVAQVFRDVPDPGDSPLHTPMTDGEKAELAQRLLDDLDGAPFWLFAYGSLIWKPAFDYDDRRPCQLHGWHRSFCMDLIGWRATPEEPGLMLALDRGGSCNGVAYRIPDDDPHDRMMQLIEREGAFHESIPWIRWVTLRAGGEAFRALAFYCTPPGHPRVIRLPMEDQARRIARAVGHAGSCTEYLFNTVSHLEELGIHDRYLWQLQHMVAGEIDTLHGPRGQAAG